MAEHHSLVVRYGSPPPHGLMDAIHAERIHRVCRATGRNAVICAVRDGHDLVTRRWWSHCEWEPEPTRRYVPHGSWLVRARLAMRREARG